MKRPCKYGVWNFTLGKCKREATWEVDHAVIGKLPVCAEHVKLMRPHPVRKLSRERDGG